MNHTLLERAKVFLQAHKNKSIWHRITTSLAAVVVFVTTYMLILPAITMERPTICGLEEHTHTKACYASSLKEALHEHDSSCYDENGNLVCQRPVVRLHEHTDECYQDSNLICGQIAYQGHTHTDACYTWEKVLVCGNGAGTSVNADGEILIDEGASETPETTAHVHTDACYAMQKVLTCLLAEGPGHTHTAACYDGPRKLICGHDGMVEIIRENSAVEYVSANDTGKILICGKKEHKHSDSCYATEQTEAKQQTEAIITEAPEEPEVVTEAQTEKQPETVITEAAETSAETQTETAPEPEPETIAQIATEQTESETVVTEAPETVAEEPEAATEAQTEKQPETVITEAAETAPEPEPETIAQIATEQAESETVVTEAPETVAEEPEVATEAQTEKQPETVMTEAAETAPETEPETAAQKASEQTESETAAETATELASEPQTETLTETAEPVPEFEKTTEAETVVAEEKVPEAQPDAEAETEYATEKLSDDTEPETETTVESETDAETETTAESETDTELETAAESESAAETETEVQTEISTETETELESESGTEPETTPEPAVETETETGAESENSAWTDEALEEAFKDGTIDSYCVAQRSASSHSTRRKAAARAAANQNAVEFGQYLTSSTVMKNQNGQWVAATEFNDGDQVKVSLNYNIPSGKITASQKQIYYQLPSGVRPIERQTGKAYHAGVAVGDYVIDTDGMITIDFYDEFANGDAFTGNIDFSGRVAYVDGGDGGKISFGGTASTITIKRPEDIKVEKAGTLSEDKQTVSYTVKVSTEKGTIGSVTVKDCFENGTGQFRGAYNRNSFKIYKVNADGSRQEISGYTPEFTTTGEQQSFEITGLPELKAGESYEISYQAAVGSVNGGEDSGAGNIKNKASAESGNVKGEASQTIEISKSMIEKRGEKIDWAEDPSIINTIKWTITVNKDKRDIGGYTLDDVLPDGVELTGKYEIKDSSGTVIESGNSFKFPYTFKDSMRDTYEVIFYSTLPDTGGNWVYITNTAKLRKDDKTYTAKGTVGVSYSTRKWSVSKGWSGTETEGNTIRLKWHADVTLPEKNLEQFTYTDSITGDHCTYAPELVKELESNLKLEIADLQSPVGRNNDYADIAIICYDANGNPVDNADTTTPVKSFKVQVTPKTGKEFKGKKLYFDYTTIANVSASDMQEGETKFFTNKGELDKDGTSPSEATGSYTKPKAEWGVSKRFVEETTAQAGEVRYKWETNISLPKGKVESFTYTDTILEPDGSNGDYHYAYASELAAAIRESLKLKVKGVNDTSLENNPYVDITITCYDSNGKEVPLTDSQTHVQQFKVTVTPKETFSLEWQSLYFNYRTAVDYSGMQKGETWNFKNKGELDKDNKEDTANHEHTSKTWNLSKKFLRTTTENDRTYCEWETVIDLPENEKKEFTYTDTILEPENSDGDYHYAYASELASAIKNSLRMSIKGGNDILFTENQENACVNFEIICYDANNNKVDNSDSTTHVQRFEVKVTPGENADFAWEKLTFRYKTIIECSNVKQGETRKFPNQGEVENLTSKAEYSYTRPNGLSKAVWKDGKNGESGKYTSDEVQIDLDASNGILSYRLLISVTPDQNGEITVKDTLPSGAKYEEGSIAGYFYDLNNSHQNRYNSSYNFGNDSYKPTVQIEESDGRQQMTIKIKGGYNDGSCATSETQTIELRYRISVKDDPSWEDLSKNSISYTNNASWDGGSASQTTEVTRKEPDELQKTAEQIVEKDADGTTERKTNRVKYTIRINPAGKDLDPNSDKLTLKDTLTMNSAGTGADLELDTVKLYYFDNTKQDGIGGMLAVSDYTLQYDETKHQMTLTLPDETPCILVYVYAMDVGNSIEPTYTNDAELSGIFSTKTESQLKDISSSAGVQKKRIDIYKVDSKNHTQLLDGAKFKLEAWKDNTWKEVGTYDAKDGYLELNTAVGGNGLEYDVLYRVTEDTPPTGYAKTEKEYDFVYMDPISNPNAEADKAWNASGAGSSGVKKENVMFVGKDGKVIYVPNQANSIKVQKVWADSKGQEVQKDSGSITVKIRRSTRKPTGCRVTVTLVSNSYGNPTKVLPAFYIEKGTGITLYGTVSWSSSENTFYSVKINGKEASVSRQSHLNYKNYSCSITTGAINEDSEVVVEVNGNGQAYDIGRTEEELMNCISYTAPKQYKEDYDSSFEENKVLSKGNNWSVILKDLAVADSNGNPYYYTVEEVGGANYNVVYTNNGIQTGTIYIKNTIPDKDTSYTLPETGGPGSRMYIIGGATLALLAAVLLYIKAAGRRYAAGCATPSEREQFRNDCSRLWSDGSNKRGKEDKRSP